jgi:outer membrane protein assembly factor BamE (lipoprotein component of BamABCDE complex)
MTPKLIRRKDYSAVLGAVALCMALAGCAHFPVQSTRNDDLFMRIHAGMTIEEVKAMLGTPDQTMPFPLSKTYAWDYWYQDTWGFIAIFSVTFGQDGVAVTKTTNRINDGSSHAN